jgi:hypothetical protein
MSDPSYPCEDCNVDMKSAGPIGYYCANDDCVSNSLEHKKKRIKEIKTSHEAQLDLTEQQRMEFLYAIHKKKADNLAFFVGRLVVNGHLDARSGAADALLEYLNIGGVDGPSTVPEWLESYEPEWLKDNDDDG